MNIQLKKRLLPLIDDLIEISEKLLVVKNVKVEIDLLKQQGELLGKIKEEIRAFKN